MRSRIALLGALCACVALGAGVWSSGAFAASNIVISQVYGGGGNTGATLTNDYIELFNRGASIELLDGWSVQYGSSTGLIGPNDSQITPLSGFISPGQHVLVQEAQGAGGGVSLSPDIIDPTPIAMAAAAGKVALVNTTTGINCGSTTVFCSAAALSTVVDLVGYGTGTNLFEGSGPTLAPSNTTSVFRSANGCVDTDNNAADFAAGPPNPRNRLSATTFCSSDSAPTVEDRSPAGGATGVSVSSDITVTFSEPVNVTDPWFTISCSSSGSHSAVATGGATAFTLNPDADFAAGESCTVNVVATQVADQDANDPPDTMAADDSWTFTTAGILPSAVVVSEVYGGGGNSGATLKNDFIELYNRTGSQISLAGWSVQYASAAGATWLVTPLAGSIPAGRNYLVQELAGGGGSLDLPGPNATGSINMSATAGKVALVSSTTALTGLCPAGAQIIDLVGYGSTASCFEGAGPTGAPSNTTSISRNGGGATDTNSNAADFTVGSPDPHGTNPVVTSTSPANGTTGVATGATIVVTFSEPVSVAGSWFSIACGTSGSHAATASAGPGPNTYTLDPATDFVAGDSCTVTIFAAGTTPALAGDYTFSFQTSAPFLCGDPATSIHEIQGSGAASPRAGEAHTIEGIVVGDFQAAGQFGGYFVQAEDADVDADPATSEGIFVFNTSNAVNVGDKVRLRGTVAEFNTLTELTSVSAFALCSTGNVLPTSTDVSLPTELEPYEGMRVRLPQSLVISEYFNYDRFGELVLALPLAGESRPFTPTAIEEPGPSALARLAANLARRITLDDGLSTQNPSTLRHPNGAPFSLANRFRGGDTVQNTVGVMDFQFGLYRIQPTGPADYTATNPRPVAPEPVGGTLRVAAMNTLNFFVTLDTTASDTGPGPCGGNANLDCRGADADQPDEFTRQRDKLLQALAGLDGDIIGLNEIENTPGVEPLESIVAGLPGYDYIDTGTIGTDAIKVGLIYRPSKVSPVGPYKLLTSAVDPRFIDTKSRPVLAQTFEENATGARFTVAVNHLKSKGSDCNDLTPPDPDLGDGQGNCSQTRKAAAQALVDWLATDPTGSGDPDFLIVGDLNSYAQEDSIDAIKAGADDTSGTSDDYTNLVQKYVGTYAYSYVFDGQSGYLDHALASASLTGQVTGLTEWHINADEPDVLDYDTSFKPPAQDALYEVNAFRTSDHDPILVGLDLNGAPSVDAGGPYTVDEGSPTLVNATGNDPDGDTLTYDWDLDNNGTFETPGQSVVFDASTIDGPASRTIRVRATDPGGGSATAHATVTIQNVAPQATFNAPASAFAGLSFTLSLTNPSDAASADTFEYAFDCGTVVGGFGTASSASCSSTTTGPLSVQGKIRDDDGGVSPYSATVSIVVTYDSLCELTRQYVTKADVENNLCDKLDAAEKADADGKPKAKDKALDAYVGQVRGQTGKSLTVAQADTLIALAGQL